MASIRVELELADGTFTTRMLHAGESVEQFNRAVAASSPALQRLANNGTNVITAMTKADGASKSFLSTLRDVALVTGIVSIGIGKIADIQHSWIGDIVKINAEMERLNYQMRSMSKAADSATDAANQVAYLREQALKMPFSLQAITNGFVKLKSTGLDPMDGSLQSIADGVAAFGGSDEAFNRTILAISQMSGKGVIQMEELRQQLGESMPRAVELMARSMGVSMGQLIKDISSGTVQAKPALQLFYDELERTYGGRARNMMQTFSGQYQASVTQIQRLATSGALKTDFFASVKQQLEDLNRFLNSRAAEQFANDLGHALGSAVRFLRSGIDTVIEFRNEIERFAIVAGGVFALRTSIAGISNFMGALGGLRTELRAVRIGMQEAQSWFALANQASFASGTAMIGAQSAARGLLAAIGPLAAGAAALAPWVVAIGLAAYGAAEYFGYFSNKVDDAYDSLIKYGAETRKQAKEISDAYIASLELQIQKEKELEMQRMENLTQNDKGDLVPDERYGPLSLLIEKLKKARVDAEKAYGDAAKREDDRVVDDARKSLDERFSDLQGDRDRKLDLVQRQFDEEMKLAKNSDDVDARRKQAIFDINKKFYQDQLDIVRGMISEQEKIFASSDGTRQIQAKKILDMLYADAVKYKQSLDDLKLGEVPMLKAPKSGQSLLEKAQKDLNRARADVEGLVGEFEGANREVAKLQQMLRDSKYGDMGREEVQALTDQLVKATEAKEKLDELMKGKKKLESDIENATMRALDKQMEIQERLSGRDLTDAQRIQLRIENGYYDGFGPKSPTREMLRSLLEGFDLQGDAANKVGDVLRNNTFGSATENRIQTVTEKLAAMSQVITGIGNGLNGLDFNKIKAPGDNMFGAPGAKVTGSAGTLLDLIASRESGGDYNATLDNGMWTGGSQNLVAMTLKEVVALQQQMLANPANRAKYDGIGSSALGRYQIVGSTLKSLMTEMGLSGDELFDKNMQDRMGMALINRRAGQGVDGLRKEWTGLQGVDATTIAQALAAQQYAPINKPAAAGFNIEAGVPTYEGSASQSFMDSWDAGVEKMKAALANLAKIDNANIDGEKKAKLVEANKEITAEIEAQKLNSDDLNKNYEKFVALIKQGKLGDGNKDPRADEYKELLANAKQLDQVERDAAERKKRLGSADRAEETLKQKSLDLSRRLAEANARITDPLEQKTTQAFRAMRTELDDYVRDVEAYYGKDSDQYRAALQKKQQMLAQFTNAETAEKAAGWAKNARDIQRGLLTERQARTQAMQEQIAQIDAAVAQFKGTEEEKVQIVAAAEAQKAAIRAQYAREMSPMDGMLQQWGDLQGNLAQQSTQWMNSLADGLTGLVTGTGNLKGVVDGILKDIINMGIKYILAQIMQGKNGASSKGGSLKGMMNTTSKGGGAKAAGGGLKKFGVAHTGAMVGATTMMRAVNPGVFKGAQRWHTGGMLGDRRLAPGEVPIIARKGEGVYTPEQLSEGLARSQSAMMQQINMPVSVTVNSNGGTPEQNADLARQTARETKEAMRAVVVEELVNQTRPGGMMAAHTRRY